MAVMREVRQAPMGWIAPCAGCLFLKRLPADDRRQNVCTFEPVFPWAHPLAYRDRSPITTKSIEGPHEAGARRYDCPARKDAP